MSIELTISPVALPMLIASVAIFLLGIFVLGRERANVVSISFLLLTATVYLWLTATALMTGVADAAAAFVLARIAYLGIAFIPAAVLQFTLALLGLERRGRWVLTAFWIVSGMFAVVFTTSRALLPGVYRYEWGYYPRLSSASALFVVWFATLLLASLVLLARAKEHSEQERRRHRAFFGALAIGYLGSVDYLPAFGLDIVPVGCIAVAGFIALAGWSVLRFRLVDLGPSHIADTLLETMPGGVIAVDSRREVRIINQVASTMLGWRAGTVRLNEVRRLLDALEKSAGTEMMPVTKWRRADGTTVDLAVASSPLFDEEGDQVGTLYALTDLTDRRRAEEHEYGATHDHLTGLPNRVRFAAAFEEQTAQIIAAGRVPTVLFVDLDGFKAVNDRYGHDAGDELLKIVAGRMRGAMRSQDLLARYGGDEFVLLAGLARPADARLIGAKLVKVISEPCSINGRAVSVGASIGAAFQGVHGRTAEELIRASDTAMYAAKRAGRGGIEVRTDDEKPPAYEIRASA